jgi:insulysin
LRKTPLSRLWYKPDTKFHTPKACIQIQFNCPESNYSPEATVLTSIFTRLLVDYLNEYAYYAQVAGLNYSIVTTMTGFQVAVSGYHHKLIVLVQKIIDKVVNFEVEEERFSVIKEKVMKDYLNVRFQQPYQQVMYNCSLLLEHKRWHTNDFIEVLPTLEACDLTAFFPQILSRIFLECYIAGNLTSNEAEELVQHIEMSLSDGPKVKAKPPFLSQHTEQRIVKLEDGADWYYSITGTNLQDENSALQTYFQVGQDNTNTNVLLELFVLAAKQDVFHQLRTVEQLGYVVFLMSK